MKFIDFFRARWNILLNLSLSVVTLLTSFVIPPRISLVVIEGSISYTVWARFVVISVILVLTYPCMKFNKPKNGVYWWGAGLIILCLALIFYFDYNRFSDTKTAFFEETNRREVLGDHLLPFARVAVDSQKREAHLDTITPDRLLESLGRPPDIWPEYEIARNSVILSQKYLICILLFTLFLIVVIQSVYCISAKK